MHMRLGGVGRWRRRGSVRAGVKVLIGRGGKAGRCEHRGWSGSEVEAGCQSRRKRRAIESRGNATCTLDVDANHSEPRRVRRPHAASRELLETCRQLDRPSSLVLECSFVDRDLDHAMNKLQSARPSEAERREAMWRFTGGESTRRLQLGIVRTTSVTTAHLSGWGSSREVGVLGIWGNCWATAFWLGTFCRVGIGMGISMACAVGYVRWEGVAEHTGTKRGRRLLREKAGG